METLKIRFHNSFTSGLDVILHPDKALTQIMILAIYGCLEANTMNQ